LGESEEEMADTSSPKNRVPPEQPGDGQIDSEKPEAVEGSGYESDRQWMVDSQLLSRDITDQRVLDAMRKVPRHKFVSELMRDLAYMDGPLPIGEGQTISQPYIVALMTQLARPKAESRALDVGTGCGYQAAVLSELVDHVYSIEIVKPLAQEARELLASLGYDNVEMRCGDGYRGWPEHAPFDLIIVAAAPDHIPQPLIDQLAPGGRLVIPVGEYSQYLVVVAKKKDGSIEKRYDAPVAFVPMTGEAKHRWKCRFSRS
jgi:protein-L-isoaspartate(D-aspartate) O-methyltransferase